MDQTVGIAGRTEDLPEPNGTSGGAGNGETVATPAARLRIGKYEVVRLLGRGGMGAVYQALDPVLEREVALKVMLPETAGDPEQKQRFEREARAVARLSHPGVVTVFDLGYHTDGSPYIVMELLRGQDLLSRVRKEPPLSLKEKLTIVAQVLDGLGHAHKAGIVHRDVKPANVFLTDEGSARIMDFGIAFFTSSAATSRSVLGTVGYMSPEQVRGERVDGRSDLFTVGSLLCELLTGRRPFDAETPMATFYRIARGQATIELPPGPEHAAVLPVLRRALAPSLEERYATAAEFAAALRACMGGGATTEATATGPDRARPTPEAARETPIRHAPGVARRVEATPARRVDPSGLFRLLRDIYVGGKSGHLHLALAGERKSLRILRGQIVHGTSDTEGEHLGDILVRYGLLSQADLERAVVIVLRERRRLGAVLGELGLLERGRIEEAVGLHAREILFSVLGRSDVSCTFEELAESLIETDLVCPLSTGQLILEATRRVLDPDLVRTVLGDMGRVLTLSSDPLLRSQRITLTPADGFLLSRVDGNLTARDVIGLVPLAVEDAERSLFSLLCTGIVDYRQRSSSASRAAARPATPPTPGPAPAVRPPAPAVTPPPTVATPPPEVVAPSPAVPAPPGNRDATPTTPASGGPSAPAAPPEDERRRSAARRVGEIRTLILDTYDVIKRDHFEVLGLERTATAAEVREAYASFARVLHPDACRYPELADLREKREAVFIRLSQAYETLRNPESRAAYERAYEPSKLRLPMRARPRPVAPAAPATPPPAPAMPPPAPATPPPAPATPPPGPTSAPGPGNGAPASPPRAGAADPGPSVVDVRLTPEHILASAERLFQDEKYWDTIQQLEPMIPRAEGPIRARAMMLLAQVYLKNPRWKKRSEGVLQSLVQEHPRHVAAYLLLADLYRSSQLPTRARSMYRKVLEIEPGHEEASRALAFLEPQEEAAPPPLGFASFFKKR